MNNIGLYTNNVKIAPQPNSHRTATLPFSNRIDARNKVKKQAARRQNTFIPRSIVFLALIMVTFACCLVLNGRSRSKMYTEQYKESMLHREINQIQNDNTAIADEINRLQNDPATIERVIRERLKMIRPNEKILVHAR